MYDLPEFKEQDPEALRQFINAHPFATIMGATKSGLPVATQIPLLIDERDGRLLLSGHMMRKTDHHLAFAENPQALCLFSGAHTYVSASWYSNPQQGSTWNYRSVQARGSLRFLDEAGLVAVMQRTSLHFEGDNAASPTVFDNLPRSYTDRMLKAIVGFEIAVEELRHVFKLSQNRDAGSYRNIIAKLQEGDGQAQEVAQLMKANGPRLFPQP